MKSKSMLVIGALFVSIFSFISVSQASAECSAADPCGTWAVVDSSGTVSNVIVCQPSVCGSGSFGGQNVVPQVAANPETHDTHGTGSYVGNAQSGSTVTYSGGTFSINENVTITKSEVEVDLDNNSSITSSVSVPVSSRTFTFEDTINNKWGYVPMAVKSYNAYGYTTFSVSSLNESEGPDNEVLNFRQTLTEKEIIAEIVSAQLKLITNKISTLLKLLQSIK
jgi:hypothetical protein